MSHKWVDLRSWPSRYGELAINERGYITLAVGDTAPTDTSAGYEVGCIFIDTNAASGSMILVNEGTAASCDFNLVMGGASAAQMATVAGLTASAADLNALDVQTLGTPAPAGFTGGTGTIYQQTRIKTNGLFKTTILFDLTGLGSSTTDLDIIGQGAAAAAHIGKLTALETGAVIDAILVTCLEAPATGVTDMDLYSAVEGTGKFDDLVTGLTETALLTSGGAWANGTQKAATVCPTAEEYLYWCNGAAGTVGTFTAGKFLIEIYGH